MKSAVAAGAISSFIALAASVVPASHGELAQSRNATLIGAGDIGSCFTPGDEATARILDSIPGIVFTLGDNAYHARWIRDPLHRCYSWARHKARTRPAIGNHEYELGRPREYFDYFGGAAGPRGAGYYSYTAGAWHVVVLNSNIDMSGDSRQLTWLRDDVRRNQTRCTIAYFHHPYFSSGPHGRSRALRHIWRALYDAGVDIVVSAHEHLYERFAPQDPAGNPDVARGIRQFIVGTGGAPLHNFRTAARNSEARIRSWGVLELTLEPDSYRGRFIAAPSGAVLDAAQGKCH